MSGLNGNGAEIVHVVERTQVQRYQPQRLEFSDEQRQMIRDSYANGATDEEFAVMMEVARARNLNPLMRQIHFVKRWDQAKGREVWSYQVAIDGFRAIAERTGLYDGQDEPEFVYDDHKHLTFARVKVYKKNCARPFVGIAHWSEFVQVKKDGKPTRMWATMPHVMLAKCAEAVALRKAFPEDMSGLYVPEEMAQADNDDDSYAAAQRREPRATNRKVIDAVPEPPTEEMTIEEQIASWSKRYNACDTVDAFKKVHTEWLSEAVRPQAVKTEASKAYVAARERLNIQAVAKHKETGELIVSLKPAPKVGTP